MGLYEPMYYCNLDHFQGKDRPLPSPINHLVSHSTQCMASDSASATRALNAILPLITGGQPYEAHQKARTFASRYSKSRQFDTAIQVLFQSAKELLKTGQQGSGTDLTTFLLEVYESKGEEINEESRGAVAFLSYHQ